jgi:hypothetical protein
MASVNQFAARMERMRQRQQRAQSIVRLRAQGWTFARIGARYGITGARAQQIFRDAGGNA